MKHALLYSLLGIVLSALLFLTGCTSTHSPAQWQPVGEKICTPWAEQVNPDCVLPEYPRPQLQRREWQNLNGLWHYAITDKDLPLPQTWDGEILVPFAVESSLSGVGRVPTVDEELWYSRTFRVPRAWNGRKVMINFGAVDWRAVVYINGIEAGRHEGGYTPFSVDATPYLHGHGAQTLTVRVYDSTDHGYQPRGKQVSRPRSIWYTSVTGIWQTVWMEPVSDNRITAVVATADIERQLMHITIETAEAKADRVLVQLLDSAGSQVIAKAYAAAGKELTLFVPDAHLWSPDSPYLYRLSLTLLRGERHLDEVCSYAAMRTISRARDAQGHWRMQLNGRTLFQYGPLDQGWWPDGLYTAPTDEALCYDIQKTKDLGFNMIRKHVKVEPARWYYHCDRLGMLVWQDMPSGDMGNEWAPRELNAGTDRQRTTASRDNYYREWTEIMNLCRAFPSVVVWVPFNEAWGQFDTEAVVAYTHRYDPSRLINAASGGNHRPAGDILDLHNYPQPDMYLYDSTRVNVLGEYGGIGLPVEGHLWWNRRNWGYIRFATPEEVTAEYVRYADMLKDLTSKGFAAAVYTQTTDVEGEVNGLMTYDRKMMKVDEQAVRTANQAVIRAASETQTTRSGLDPQRFRSLRQGKTTRLYVLENKNGMEVCITNFGGRIVSLLVPDNEGVMRDIVLGFDNVEDYATIPSDFGACIGRYANRINKGQITLDDRTYQLETNNFGHTLHGGPTGWQYRVFHAEQPDAHTLRLSIVSDDGDNGFPGRVEAGCIYTLTDDNTLRMEYFGTTDQPTVINMTNHTYFNLSGSGAVTAMNHLLWVNANRMTPVDDTFMTTGEVQTIAQGSPFDFFTTAKPIAKDINADDQQLKHGHGYDHNFVLNPATEGLTHAADLCCPETGIALAVYTAEPGLQLYTGNFLDGTVSGKRGEVYAHRNAVCLETQKYPDSPNHPEWPSPVLRPGQTYRTVTEFRFGLTH